MGTPQKHRYLVLIGLFMVTGLAVMGLTGFNRATLKPPLSGYFSRMPGYTLIRPQELEPSAYKMLDLDDYTFADYQGPDGKVNLFIGYYYTADKAYAAHSPLVCYPSHGWKIDQSPQRREMAVGPHTIHYEEIVTSLAEQKELVLYWYQARDLANTQVYRNKMAMGYNKLMHNHQQHAFVRVSLPLAGSNVEAARQAAARFINVMYPQFLTYILQDDVPVQP